MSSATDTPFAADRSAAETSGRGALLLLVGFGALWLVVSGVLALVSGVQAHVPSFLADCPLLNYGRCRALAETAFSYGWIANAGLAVALWVLARLSGGPLRARGWVAVGALFWNAGVAIGLAGIATGQATSIPGLEIPGPVQPVLLAAYGAMGISGVLAWSGRGRRTLFAAQWYAAAAIFLFPWIFSIAQVTLVWAPVHGVLQAIGGVWAAQALSSLWIAPLALAGAYYVVPKITGRTLPAYDLALLGFWCLVFIGGWTSGRRLIGGPVPAWISTLGIVATVILLPHYIIAFLNLRGALSRASSPALAFIGFGVAAYVLGGFVDSVTAMRSVAATTQFTWFEDAQRELSVYGGASMMLFGALAYAVPRLAGRPWASAGLLKGQLGLALVGVVVLVVAKAAAGLIQGADLLTPSVSFAAIGEDTRTWLSIATVGDAILLLSSILFAFNIALTIGCCRAGAGQEAPSA